jgi:hypothetical protein
MSLREVIAVLLGLNKKPVLVPIPVKSNNNQQKR